MNPHDFFDITLGNVITWLGALIGAVAFWVKLKDKVDNVAERLKDQDKRISGMIEEIRTQGSPSSRTAIMVLNSRVESHGDRINRMEDAIASIAAIQVSVKWIEDWVRNQQNK